VDAVHRLVAASEQAGGMTFTDEDSNIITDDDNEEIQQAMENDEPIPVLDNHHENIINDSREEIDEEAITGVNEDNTVDADDITPPVLDNQDEAITGVSNEQSTDSTHDNTQLITEEENDPDKCVTIGDIDITLEMNVSNRETETEQTKMKEQM